MGTGRVMRMAVADLMRSNVFIFGASVLFISRNHFHHFFFFLIFTCSSRDLIELNESPELLKKNNESHFIIFFFQFSFFFSNVKREGWNDEI